MAIAYFGHGGYGSVDANYPAQTDISGNPIPIPAGSLGIIVVTNKVGTIQPVTPATWTLQGSYEVGTGAAGADQGTLRVTMFTKQLAGGETGQVTFDTTSWSGQQFIMHVVTKDASETWSVAPLGSASYTAGGTAFSLTGPTSHTYAVNDMVFWFNAITSDTPTLTVRQGSLGSLSINRDGIVAAATTSGNDMRSSSDRAVVLTAGIATWGFTGTLSAASTGGGVALRVRGETPVGSPANAGADLTNIEPFSTVNLSGTNGTTWSQTAGTPSVTITQSSPGQASFVAPATIDGTTLTFTLAGTNGGASDTMTATIYSHNEWTRRSGILRPLRIQLRKQGVLVPTSTTGTVVEPPPPPPPNNFDSFGTPTTYVVLSGTTGVTDVAGIVDSLSTPGYVFLIGDGPDTSIRAINKTTGALAATFAIGSGMNALDTEDLVRRKVGTTSHIFVADTGNNNLDRTSHKLIRITEPSIMASTTLTATAFGVSFSDGNIDKDCDALMFSPDGRAYLVTKAASGTTTAGRRGIYRGPDVLLNKSQAAENIFTRVAEAPANVTSAAWHPTANFFITMSATSTTGGFTATVYNGTTFEIVQSVPISITREPQDLNRGAFSSLTFENDGSALLASIDNSTEQVGIYRIPVVVT